MERESNRASADAEGGARMELPLTAVLGASRVCRSVAEIFDTTQQVASERGWYRAAQALARGVREERQLHSSERRFVGDALNGMVRGLRRLRTLVLAAAGPQPSKPAAKGAAKDADGRVGGLALYLAWLADQSGASLLNDAATAPLRDALVAARLDPARLHACAAALDEALVAVQSEDLGADRDARLGAALSYPDWLVAAVTADLGAARAAALLAAQNHRGPLTLRANLLRGTREALSERLLAEGVRATPGPLALASLLVDTRDARVNVYGLRAFQEGWLELQDEGSQLIAELVAPPPGGAVIDACAGAGGKTLALGALLGNRGRLLALDIDDEKLQELRRRTRRAGLTNVQARLLTPGPGALQAAVRAAPGWERGAARVLCDVPCSGLGVLRRNPEARWRLRPQDLVELPQIQRGILEEAAPLVAPGGRLIYATCTINRAENDDIVDGFLRAHPEFREMPAREILSGGSARAARVGDGARLRLLPGLHPEPSSLPEGQGPDGFFAAVLRRPE